MFQRRSTRSGVVLAALGLACSPLAACADDDDAAETTQEEVEAVAVDYEFEGLPDRVEAGTRLSLVNESSSELHEIVAVRLPDDEDRSVEELVSLPPEEMMAATAGEPAAVLLASPDGGEVVTAVGDGVLSEPGRYAILCGIPTGADPDAYLEAAAQSEGEPPEVAGGPPHFVHGMYAELIVE